MTDSPPAGAGPFSVIVPVENDPPTTDDGAKVKLFGIVGEIVKDVDTEIPSAAAVIFVDRVEVTAVVLIANVAEVAPAATVTVPGGAALLLLELRLTTSPAGGATPLNETVPVDELPPTTVVGETVNPAGADGVMVRVPETD